MPQKHFKMYAPFGVATKRFANIGFHPALDKSGSYKKEITKTGPGSYNPKPARCKSKRGVHWDTELETEEFSKNMGFRNANLLQEREFLKSLGGPGTNDENEACYKREDSSVLKNTGFGRAKRFRSLEESRSFPPPNTYYTNLNKTSTLTRKQFSNTPTFEWDGFLDRFKSTAPKYTLACNRYDIKDGKGIEDILERVVSLRGPYELFTGPRDGSTIKNYFGPSSLKVPEYFYIPPSDVDVLLHHPSKKRCGQFLKAKRFTKKPTVRTMLNDISLCYRDPNDPGPAHYDISHTNSIKVKKESKYPFDKSQVNARPPINWTIYPGPGRYNPKQIKCMKVKRPTWGFLSKTERNVFNVIDYTSF